MLLHVALNGEADTLVTGDADLLVLHEELRHSHELAILSLSGLLAGS